MIQTINLVRFNIIDQYMAETEGVASISICLGNQYYKEVRFYLLMNYSLFSTSRAIQILNQKYISLKMLQKK